MYRKIALILALALTTGMYAQKQHFIIPPFLHPGDTIAIVSPSSKLSDQRIALGDSVLRHWGFVPIHSGYTQGHEVLSHYAGTQHERIADLTWAFQNPSVKAIICARGGYGLIHLVDSLPLRLFHENPKWFVGFSDITTMHCLLNKAGVASIHGAMYTSMRRNMGNDSTCQLMKDILLGKFPTYHVVPHALNHYGKAKARLVGGNVSTFLPLIDTQYDPTRLPDGTILFLEEVDENYHTIDRFLNTMKLHGVLSRIKGIIVGDFTDCNKDIAYNHIYEMLDTYFAPLNIPVCYGFPGGHDKVNLPLIEGALVNFSVNQQGADISFEKR